MVLGDLQIIVDDRGHCAYASMRDPSDITQLTMGTVVLDTRHYLTVPEERIPKIKSVLTLQGGRVVHGDLH